MKKTALIIAILVLFAPFLKAQTSEIPKGKARIYLLRSTGYIGALGKFDFRVNNKVVCSLGNNKYTILDIDTGDVRISTLKIKKNGKNMSGDNSLNLKLEENTVYYLNFYVGISKGQGWEQLTVKEVAEGMISKLKIDTCN